MSNIGTLSPATANSWLATQCRIIPGIVCAAMFSKDGGYGEFPWPTARWPNCSESMNPGLRVAAARALSQGQPVVCGQQQSPDVTEVSGLHIACPILIDGAVEGVIAVETEGSDKQHQRAVMQLLQWGSMWLQFTLNQDAAAENGFPVTMLQIIAAGLEHSQCKAAAMACATELASSLECERVSIGFLKGSHIKVEAISNSANFDAQANLVRTIELAMAESMEQQSTVAHPAQGDTGGQVVSAHTRICRELKSGSACSVPMVAEGKQVGVICFERLSDEPLDADSIKHFEVITALLGPILELKRQRQTHPVKQLLDSGMAFARKLVGPAHSGLKLGTGVLAGAIIALSLLEGDYRASGTAVLEGSVQRVVVAPMDGFIKTASVRPGDLVGEGQVLGSLNDEDLRLERLRWSSQLAQLQKEYREALGNRNRTQVGILGAQIDQANAQLQLLDEQLSRTEFLAPFDGIVVSGDLSQELGSPVERGRVLFTVAPLDSYRVVVQIEEQEIAALAEGQTGQLALSALPGERIPVTVETITPVSTAEDGRNFFRVEASLSGATDKLRPGMQGVAKIDIDERKLIWIWTRSMVDWLRMRTWSWLG